MDLGTLANVAMSGINNMSDGSPLKFKLKYLAIGGAIGAAGASWAIWRALKKEKEAQSANQA